LNCLVELLTVNETYFFREPAHLKLLIERIIPEIVEERKGRQVRIMSAGCSTGEEPYSIAVLLREQFGDERAGLFAITGVDIDATAIDKARQGIYGKASFRGASASLLARYFEPSGREEYRISAEIRRDVTFEVVNLLGTDYPASMQLPDVILYRNVSIYFPVRVQHEIFSRLAGLLTEGGYLLVGATETFHHDLGILSLVEKDELFFYRKLPDIRIEDRRDRRRNCNENRVPTAGRDRSALPPVPPRERTVPHVHVSARCAPQHTTEQCASAVSPLGSQELFDDALGLVRDNRPDEAIELLDTLIERNGSFVKAFSLKGSILLNASRFDEARDTCISALAVAPLCLEASLMLGIIARHQEDDDEALKRFREAIYLDAACWPGHFHTAEIMFSRGDRKRARSGYEATLRIFENGIPQEHERAFFPLRFKTDQFVVICRHKLALINNQGT
jgi:chemotaxis protein methyltransferase CheR